jgi:hypothetical protein
LGSTNSFLLQTDRALLASSPLVSRNTAASVSSKPLVPVKSNPRSRGRGSQNCVSPHNSQFSISQSPAHSMSAEKGTARVERRAGILHFNSLRGQRRYFPLYNYLYSHYFRLIYSSDRSCFVISASILLLRHVHTGCCLL